MALRFELYVTFDSRCCPKRHSNWPAPGVARCGEQNGEGCGLLFYIPSRKFGRSALVLLAPFPDDGQSILDVFLRVGIGVGVKNLPLGRNHIGNTVGEGRAHKRNVERGIIGLDHRKAGVRANREFVAALLGRKVALHLDLVARKANDARAGGLEILYTFDAFRASGQC